MAETQIAVVGGESLLGRELRDQLSDKGLASNIRLVGTGETGILSMQDDEPVVISALDRDQLERAGLVFLCGSPASSRKAYDLLADSKTKPVIIDLTGGLEDQPQARLRAPSIEKDGFTAADAKIQVVAHPAAIVTAKILGRVQKRFAVRHAVVQILEPASERGQAGITELQQQTANLLSFKPLPKDIFDQQLAFNLLPRYGCDAPDGLEDIEQRIERHVATLMGSLKSSPLPSLRLIQAPVFHGYSLSIWIDFTDAPTVPQFSEALASADIEVRGSDLEPPTNVGSVGQPGLTVGLIEVDRSYPNALWMWAVADNFRVLADNAIEAARPVLTGERA